MHIARFCFQLGMPFNPQTQEDEAETLRGEIAKKQPSTIGLLRYGLPLVDTYGSVSIQSVL